MAEKKMTPKQETEEIMAELEDLWQKFDRLWDDLPKENWQQKFGKDWVFSDQPYHLAFFDRMVATSLTEDPNKTKDKLHMQDFAEINAWNESEFKKRPKRYTVEKARQDFKASHALIRKAVKQRSGKMNGRVWLPLFFGWVRAVDSLNAALIHSVGEYIELCLRTNHAIDVLPVSMKRREHFMLYFMSLSVSPEESAKRNFVLGWNFVKDAPSSWTITIKGGKGTLKEGKARHADLTMTSSLAAFEKMIRKMKHPLLMMLSGEMKVQGYKNMPVFMKLFPQP